MSELASNTASVTVLVPIIIGVAVSLGLDPVAPAVATTIAGSLGFMLPVSTAPNAIVYGSGLLPAKTLMKTGVIIDIIGIVVVIFWIWVMRPLLQLG